MNVLKEIVVCGGGAAGLVAALAAAGKILCCGRRKTMLHWGKEQQRSDRMGLDLYAGTLTRYYAGNWKSIVQQWAEANGYGFQRITPQDGEQPLPPQQVQALVEAWRDQLLGALEQAGLGKNRPWPEDNEKDYYTDKPDWDAFGALLLVAACHSYGEPVPPTVEKGWDFWQQPQIAQLTQDQDKVWSLLRGATFWLPLEGSFFFSGQLPTGVEAVIGTVGALRAELEQLNKMAWQADEATILDWCSSEGYPVDVELGPDGKPKPVGTSHHTTYDSQSLAKFAFSIFWQAVAFAEKEQVPILMDF